MEPGMARQQLDKTLAHRTGCPQDSDGYWLHLSPPLLAVKAAPGPAQTADGWRERSGSRPH